MRPRVYREECEEKRGLRFTDVSIVKDEGARRLDQARCTLECICDAGAKSLQLLFECSLPLTMERRLFISLEQKKCAALVLVAILGGNIEA
jgi:hypothetical protein